jgi:hypothetical protein
MFFASGGAAIDLRSRGSAAIEVFELQFPARCGAPEILRRLFEPRVHVFPPHPGFPDLAGLSEHLTRLHAAERDKFLGRVTGRSTD